jgi:hypothetical protein
VLLFDNIGFRRSGFKVGYDQWVLLAWQYLDEECQKRLRVFGLPNDAKTFDEAYAQLDDLVAAVLPQQVHIDQLAEATIPLYDQALQLAVAGKLPPTDDPTVRERPNTISKRMRGLWSTRVRRCLLPIF